MAEKGPRLSFGSRVMGILRQITVEPFLFLTIFGYMVRAVSFQSLLMDRACRTMYNYTDDICDHIESYPTEKAQSTIGGNNLYTGWMLMTSLPSVVVAVFLGPWSDKYSRKYPILLGIFGMFAEAVASAALTAFPYVSPWLFAIAALLSGMCGGFVMTVSSCFSYLSDVTEPKTRSTRFAILEFCFDMAMLTGGFTGGQIFNTYGYMSVMVMSPLVFLIAIAYGVFYLKDTKPKIEAGRRWEVMKDLVSLDNIKQSYHTCTRARPGNMRLQIWLLVWVNIAQRLTEMGYLAVGYPYVRIMYQWGVTAFSNANIILAILNGMVTVVVVPFLSSKLFLHEAAIGLIGVMSGLAKFTFLAVSYNIFLFYISAVSGSITTAVVIGVKSRISKLVHKDELGRAFSFLGIFEALTPLFGTVVFLQIYNASVNTFPGMSFLAMVVLLAPSAVIYLWMMGMPTVSQGTFGRNDDEQTARPLEDIKPGKNYEKLEEEKY